MLNGGLGLLWLALIVLPNFAIAGDYYAVPAEKRVARTYWARPGVNEISVEFFKEPELRTRLPVYKKTKFKILDVVAGDGFPDPEILYRVKLQSGEEGYIELTAFEEGLYAELRPNQVMSSEFTPPLGVGLHVYIFERKSIFTADPDVIWSRIKNDGPRFFRRLPPDDGKDFVLPGKRP
jgi:hypothetical protein